VEYHGLRFLHFAVDPISLFPLNPVVRRLFLSFSLGWKQPQSCQLQTTTKGGELPSEIQFTAGLNQLEMFIEMHQERQAFAKWKWFSEQTLCVRKSIGSIHLLQAP